MRRLRLLIAVALLGPVFVGCDGDKAQFGVTLTQDGQPQILYRPCRENRVYDLYAEPVGDLNPLWHVTSETGSEERVFVVGQTPPGFQEVVALRGSLPSKIVVALTTEPDGRLKSSVDAEAIPLADIERGTVFVPRQGRMSEEEFRRLSTCTGRHALPFS